MFETGGTTDVLEKSPWQKYALRFVAGCLVTILIFCMLLIPSAKRAAAESVEKAAQQKFSVELAKNPMVASNWGARRPHCRLKPKSDGCQAKFDRQTILYDNSIVTEPDRIWIIPADVEPIAVGDHRVTYTHYDPKTKRETTHFRPQQQ
jgi:hypothetical protein